MLLISRWLLFYGGLRCSQSLFVCSKADQVIDSMEAASLFVIEQLVRRSSIARDLYQHRRHTVAASYCVSYRQLHHLTYIPTGTFLVNVWATFEAMKWVKPAYLADLSTAITSENLYIALLYIRIPCVLQKSKRLNNWPCK